MRSKIIAISLFSLMTLHVAWVVADDQPQEIPLWAGGAPGSEARKEEPVKRAEQKGNEYTIANVHNPSLTVFLPSKEKATGAAVVIAPGGGHSSLWVVHEGMNEAKWLADHGVAALVLKYRLARERGSPYKLPETPTQDGQRAIRLVRSRAAQWGIDPARVGIMGFSAGGELAAMTCNADGKGKDDADDPIERLRARPDFQALIYSGPLGIRDQTVTKEMNLPPTFIAVGDTDNFSPILTNHYLALRKAGVSAELHIYAKTGHGFGMREANSGRPSNAFLERFFEFLGAQGMLKKG